MFYVNGQSFELGDQSALEIVIGNGYSMPYNCQDGRCKNCMITDLNTGENHLACQTYPFNDQKFLCENFEKFKLPDVRLLPMKIIKVCKVGKFFEVEFVYSKSVSIEYLRGQYINISISGLKRSYSICEINDNKKRLKIIISPVEAGVGSEYFASKPIGDKLRVEIPLGSFVYRNPRNDNTLSAYVCTGSGIAPIINTFNDGNGVPQNVSIYWGVRDYCEMVAKVYSRFNGRIKLFVSGSGAQDNHEKGRVNWERIDCFSSIDSWYLVGNPQMIDEFSFQIKKLEQKVKIYSDPFV